MDGQIDEWMDGSYGIVENEKAHVIMMVLQGRATIQLCQWLVTPKAQREKERGKERKRIK